MRERPPEKQRILRDGIGLHTAVTAGLVAALLCCVWQLLRLTGFGAACPCIILSGLWWQARGSRSTRRPLAFVLGVAALSAGFTLVGQHFAVAPGPMLVWAAIGLGGSLAFAAVAPALFSGLYPDIEQAAELSAEPSTAEWGHRDVQAPLQKWSAAAPENEEESDAEFEAGSRDTTGPLRIGARDAFLSHSITRTIGSTQDELFAELTVTFSSGERQTWVHIPFSPLFSHSPQIECEADAFNVRIDIDRVLPYGVRLKARRQGDLSEPLTCMLEVSAATSQPNVRVA